MYRFSTSRRDSSCSASLMTTSPSSARLSARRVPDGTPRGRRSHEGPTTRRLQTVAAYLPSSSSATLRCREGRRPALRPGTPPRDPDVSGGEPAVEPAVQQLEYLRSLRNRLVQQGERDHFRRGPIRSGGGAFEMSFLSPSEVIPGKVVSRSVGLEDVTAAADFETAQSATAWLKRNRRPPACPPLRPRRCPNFAFSPPSSVPIADRRPFCRRLFLEVGMRWGLPRTIGNAGRRLGENDMAQGVLRQTIDIRSRRSSARVDGLSPAP
jgi:hypothetical protein